MEDIRKAIETILDEMNDAGVLRHGGLFVLGCSTSEVAGERIGKGSSQEIGNVIIDTLLEKLSAWDMTLAVGCCEHLNRAVAMPRAEAEKRGYEIVTVKPALHAGGACGVAYFARMSDPVMVEAIQADAGLDIGHTMIGMHLKRVAVPFRATVTHVCKAPVVMAYTRPKYVGGPRATYP